MKAIQKAVQTTAQPLIEVRKNQTVVSSLQLAKDFGKLHKDVLRDVRNLECSEGFQGRNFALSFYINSLPNGGHKKLPMYYITRDGFTFLAMGFTGKEASKFKEEYINAFNMMEQKLREIEIKGSKKGFITESALQIQRDQTNLYMESTKYWQGQANLYLDRLLEAAEIEARMAGNMLRVVEQTQTLRDQLRNMRR